MLLGDGKGEPFTVATRSPAWTKPKFWVVAMTTLAVQLICFNSSSSTRTLDVSAGQ
ncbi:MAG: hypothetical protein QM757_22840 [Paludibaculum sp.]